MAYEDITALRGKVDRLRKPFQGGLIQILRDRKANKLDEELQEKEKRNQENFSRELGMLLRGAETGMTGQVGMGQGMPAQLNQFMPTDPEVQKLAAELRLGRVANSEKMTPDMQEYNFSKANPDFADFVRSTGASKGGSIPAAIQQYEYWKQLPPNEQAAFMAQLRNPYLNTGSEFTNAYSGSEIPISLKPGEEPVVRGAQAAAVEAAKVNAIPDRVAAQTAAERQANLPGATRRLESQREDANFMESLIDEAKDAASNWTTGVLGSVANRIPGTPAFDLARTVDTIKANIGFDELQAMRDASPTGGALGQVAVQELVYLQSLLGNLEQSQSKEQFVQNLERVREGIRRVVHGSERQFQQTYGGEGANGLSPEEQAELEELRARFGGR